MTSVDPVRSRLNEIAAIDAEFKRTGILDKGRLLGLAADLANTVPSLVAALNAVLELHKRTESKIVRGERYCAHCGSLYPCKTVRAVAAALGVIHD